MFIADPSRPEPTIRELAAQIQALEAQFAWWKRDQEYRDDVLGMKRAWQDSNEGNLDNDVPLTIDLYIPPTTKHIEKVILRMRLLPFVACVGSSTEWVEEGLGPGMSSTAIWRGPTDYVNGYTSDDGVHDHEGEVSPDGGHSHTVYLPEHYHQVYTVAHFHEIKHANITLTKPTSVTIHINGVNVTNALGGPFNSDQESLDITQYIQAIGWNEIKFYSKGEIGRIRATVYAEIYLP